MMATKIDGSEYETAGEMHYIQVYNRLHYFITDSEVKLEIGSNGAEPLFQVI
jgi:hypothetical protein